MPVVGHYTLGAYVDPDNRLIRHDAHAIQRVEAEPRWDLRPRGAPREEGSIGPLAPAKTVERPSPVPPVAPVAGAEVKLPLLPEVAALGPDPEGIIDLSRSPGVGGDRDNPFSVGAVSEATRDIVVVVGGIIRGVSPCALINGRPVEPGEMVDTLKLVRLEPDAVLLQQSEQFVRIPIGGKAVRVRVAL